MKTYLRSFDVWLDDVDNEDLINDIIGKFCPEHRSPEHDRPWLMAAEKIWQHEQTIIRSLLKTKQGEKTDE